MKFVKRDMPEIVDETMAYIKEIRDETTVTIYDRLPYDISQHINVKGGSSKILKNGRKTKPKKTKKNRNRYRSMKSVKSSLKNLKDLIRCNFGFSENEFFITLKYYKATDENKRLSKVALDMLKFLDILDMEEALKNNNLSYICKYEKNVNGSWHMHIIIRIEAGEEGNNPIDGKKLQIITETAWPLGEAHIESITTGHIKSLVSYLTEIKKPTAEYEEYKENLRAGLVKANKQYTKYRKYEQSAFYPNNSNVFTTSKGLIKPVKQTTTKKEAEAMAVGKELKNTYLALIVDDEGEVVNGITKAVYK